MAKKTKKRITINAFEKVMKENYQPVVEVEWNGLTIEIKRTLSFAEMMGLISSVVAACYNAETGIYTPDVKSFAIKLMVLENYANFTMPSNPEKMYELIYCTGALDVVMPHINQAQFREICDSIDERLDYITSANIEAANKQITEMFSSMDGIQEQLSSLFGKVSDEDVKNLVGALVNGKFDEEELVKAVLNEKSKDSEQPKVIALPTE